ncbi:hypothetical protein [Burkholderia sp. SCN-KJ]|nr:hypothetical protein [Burkholderia sp. SCN-KJ]MCR4466795.1 hypothetical protein [Burkholderia sp. SCN-KJ]
MKSPSGPKKDVEQEFECAPSIDAVRIGMEVHRDVVDRLTAA